MLEKILTKLKEQRVQNSSLTDRSLEDLAKTLQVFITTDELLNSADFSVAIKSLEGNISHTAAEAAKTAKEAAEKAVKEQKTGKPKKEEIPSGTPPSEDEPPAWAKAIIEQNKHLSEGLSKLRTEKVTNDRLEKLQTVLKESPQFFKGPIISGFSRLNFETEEEFDAYVKQVETSRDQFQQAAKEQGLNTFAPSSDIKKPKENGETPVISDARELLNKEREKQNKAKAS